MKLEIGKQYVRRDGWISPPVTASPRDVGFPFRAGIYAYTAAGKYCVGVDSRDLISEYTPTTYNIKEEEEQCRNEQYL